VNFLKWLYPGMHIKRWLVLLLIGVVIVGLGFAYVLRQAYTAYTFPGFVYYITLQFIPRYIRGALFIAGGVGMIIGATLALNRSLLSALLPPRDESLVNMIYHYRYLKRGPKIVAIGGGTGLSALLRGLKEHTGNLTAIVTVADDGGSSGRLRRELGVLPPGDFRNCIAALADAEPLMTRLFQYRFSEGSGLEGHSFGNLFIVAMSGVTGNFEQAVRESSRVLAVRGQILPSTLANVTLCAEIEGADTVRGESNIGQSKARIRRVFLQPDNVQAHPEAMRAILEADLIVLGPGSLYTSVLPNLLVDGIRRAIRASSALKVYVCNVATQKGETDNFTVVDHAEALLENAGEGLFDLVLVNSNIAGALPGGVQPVYMKADQPSVFYPVLVDVVNEENRLRHDSKKLGANLIRLYYDSRQSRNGAASNGRAKSVSQLAQ
jgi:uncharacterized cofD-like protein